MKKDWEVMTTHDFRNVSVNKNIECDERSGSRRRCFDIRIAFGIELRKYYCSRVTIVLFDYRECTEISPFYDKRSEHWGVGLQRKIYISERLKGRTAIKD
jgi:hypothetical protein